MVFFLYWPEWPKTKDKQPNCPSTDKWINDGIVNAGYTYSETSLDNAEE